MKNAIVNILRFIKGERLVLGVHPLMNIVRIDIIDIKSDRSILTKVDQGVLWSYTSSEAEELVRSLFDELKELSKTL